MKRYILSVSFLLITFVLTAQITTPVIKANFGVDGDLRSNFFDGNVLAGNDDWFNYGFAGSGVGIIDTTGAAALVAGYTSNPASRKQTVIRTMAYPPFSTVNGNRFVDAVWVRDYHGDDSTMFANGSNKNGMSPVDWSCPVAQSTPDKNEILEMMMHVRRGGTTGNDSLWLYGGISIENVNGNHYFDFEMYQTDIVYNKSTRTFTGYGPDAGHTSWKFDAAGNVIQAGDIILTAEFNSASLNFLGARIWVDIDDLTNVVPQTFNWGGLFDGDGSGAQYGYASISPKTAGAFYSGLISDDYQWTGPFKVVYGDNSVEPDYEPGQFLEFSVNLTKLGLDPVTLLGGSTCGRPFRRVMVKTRASTSFTSELKDFVAPVEFSAIKEPVLTADITVFCGVVSVSNISISNSLSTSTYNWYTPNGHFADTSNKTSVYVDAPGTYIVLQRLQSSCPLYASDTFTIGLNPSCGVLANSLKDFTASLTTDKKALLKWAYPQDKLLKYFTVERSIDGLHYQQVQQVNAAETKNELNYYTAFDNLSTLTNGTVYYRIRTTGISGDVQYSNVVRLSLAGNDLRPTVSIVPNPVKDAASLNIYVNEDRAAQIKFYNVNGGLLMSSNRAVKKGMNNLSFTGFNNWKQGMYIVKVLLGKDVFTQKLMVAKNQ